MSLKRTSKWVAAGAAAAFVGTFIAAPTPAVAAAGIPMVKSRPLPPGPPRFLENYEFLSDPAERTDKFDALRHINIGDSSWLNIGAGVRLIYENDQNMDGGSSHDNFYQTRFHLSTDWHLFDNAARLYLQLANTGTHDKDGDLAPVDGSGTEMHQAFLQFNIPTEGGNTYMRVGRQEMWLGAGWLVTTRAIPNVRLSYDGVRFSYQGDNGYALNVFAFRPVVANNSRKAFNNKSNSGFSYYGIYGTIPLTENINQDIYLLGRHRDGAAAAGKPDFAVGPAGGPKSNSDTPYTAEEDRYTLGTRLFGGFGNLSFTADFDYQFGKHKAGGKSYDINAWGVQSLTEYTFKDVTMAPSVGLRLDATSGNRSSSSDYTRFNAMDNSAGKFYGNIGLIGASNMLAVGPKFGFSPLDDLHVSAMALWLRRMSTDDYAYNAPGLPLNKTELGSSHKMGLTYDLAARWTPTSNLTIGLEYQYYDVSGSMKNAFKHNPQYFTVRTFYRF